MRRWLAGIVAVMLGGAVAHAQDPAPSSPLAGSAPGGAAAKELPQRRPTPLPPPVAGGEAAAAPTPVIVERAVVDPRSVRPIPPSQPARSAGRFEPRIFDGAPAPSNAYDDVVALTFTTRGKAQTCSGVAVSADTILTAGHCTCGAPNSYSVVTGPDSRAARRGERLLVRDFTAFPGYSCDRRAEDQTGLDLAMFRLTKPSQHLEERVRPISLMADAIRNERPTELRVYGYGFTEHGALGERRETFVPVATLTCVGRRWRGTGCAPFVEFVLSARGVRNAAGRPSIKDSCGGDSGGPVFLITGTRSYLVGIVSRGLAGGPMIAGKPCGGGGIYSTVGRHSVINWLTNEGTQLCLRDGACKVATRFGP